MAQSTRPRKRPSVVLLALSPPLALRRRPGAGGGVGAPTRTSSNVDVNPRDVGCRRMRPVAGAPDWYVLANSQPGSRATRAVQAGGGAPAPPSPVPSQGAGPSDANARRASTSGAPSSVSCSTVAGTAPAGRRAPATRPPTASCSSTRGAPSRSSRATAATPPALPPPMAPGGIHASPDAAPPSL